MSVVADHVQCYSGALSNLWHETDQLYRTHRNEAAFIRQELISYSNGVRNLASQHYAFSHLTPIAELEPILDSSMQCSCNTGMYGFQADTVAYEWNPASLGADGLVAQALPGRYSHCSEHIDDRDGEAVWAAEMTNAYDISACTYTPNVNEAAYSSLETTGRTEIQMGIFSGADCHHRRLLPKAATVEMNSALHSQIQSPHQDLAAMKLPQALHDSIEPVDEAQDLKMSVLLSTTGNQRCVTSARELFASAWKFAACPSSPSLLTLDQVFTQLQYFSGMQDAFVLQRRLVLLRLLDYHTLILKKIAHEYQGCGKTPPTGTRLESLAIDQLTVGGIPGIESPDAAPSKTLWRSKYGPERKRVQNLRQAAKHWGMAAKRLGTGIIALIPIERRGGPSTAWVLPCTCQRSNTADMHNSFEELHDENAEFLIARLAEKDDGHIMKLAKLFTPLTEALFTGQDGLSSLLADLDNHLDGL